MAFVHECKLCENFGITCADLHYLPKRYIDFKGPDFLLYIPAPTIAECPGYQKQDPSAVQPQLRNRLVTQTENMLREVSLLPLGLLNNGASNSSDTPPLWHSDDPI